MKRKRPAEPGKKRFASRQEAAAFLISFLVLACCDVPRANCTSVDPKGDLVGIDSFQNWKKQWLEQEGYAKEDKANKNTATIKVDKRSFEIPSGQDDEQLGNSSNDYLSMMETAGSGNEYIHSAAVIQVYEDSIATLSSNDYLTMMEEASDENDQSSAAAIKVDKRSFEIPSGHDDEQTDTSSNDYLSIVETAGSGNGHMYVGVAKNNAEGDGKVDGESCTSDDECANQTCGIRSLRSAMINLSSPEGRICCPYSRYIDFGTEFGRVCAINAAYQENVAESHQEAVLDNRSYLARGDFCDTDSQCANRKCGLESAALNRLDRPRRICCPFDEYMTFGQTYGKVCLIYTIAPEAVIHEMDSVIIVSESSSKAPHTTIPTASPSKVPSSAKISDAPTGAPVVTRDVAIESLQEPSRTDQSYLDRGEACEADNQCANGKCGLDSAAASRYGPLKICCPFDEYMDFGDPFGNVCLLYYTMPSGPDAKDISSLLDSPPSQPNTSYSTRPAALDSKEKLGTVASGDDSSEWSSDLIFPVASPTVPSNVEAFFSSNAPTSKPVTPTSNASSDQLVLENEKPTEPPSQGPDLSPSAYTIVDKNSIRLSLVVGNTGDDKNSLDLGLLAKPLQDYLSRETKTKIMNSRSTMIVDAALAVTFQGVILSNFDYISIGSFSGRRQLGHYLNYDEMEIVFDCAVVLNERLIAKSTVTQRSLIENLDKYMNPVLQRANNDENLLSAVQNSANRVVSVTFPGFVAGSDGQDIMTRLGGINAFEKQAESSSDNSVGFWKVFDNNVVRGTAIATIALVGLGFIFGAYLLVKKPRTAKSSRKKIIRVEPGSKKKMGSRLTRSTEGHVRLSSGPYGKDSEVKRGSEDSSPTLNSYSEDPKTKIDIEAASRSHLEVEGNNGNENRSYHVELNNCPWGIDYATNSDNFVADSVTNTNHKGRNKVKATKSRGVGSGISWLPRTILTTVDEEEEPDEVLSEGGMSDITLEGPPRVYATSSGKQSTETDEKPLPLHARALSYMGFTDQLRESTKLSNERIQNSTAANKFNVSYASKNAKPSTKSSNEEDRNFLNRYGLPTIEEEVTKKTEGGGKSNGINWGSRGDFFMEI